MNAAGPGGESQQHPAWRRRLAVAAVPLGILAALAFLTVRAVSRCPPGGEGEGPPMPEDYFEYPLGNARVIDAVEEAELAYVPNVPDRLGEPLRIQADFSRFRGAREIAWAFRHPEYGRFIIQERLESRSGIENYIRHQAAQECGCRTTSGGGTECVYGERELITLPGGITALVFVGDPNTFVEWVEPLRVLDDEAIRERRENIPDPGLHVTVIGPSETFTRDVAVAVAQRM